MQKEFKERLITTLILIPFSFYLIFKGSFYFISFLLICFFLTCLEWNRMTRNKKFEFIGYLFLIFSFYSAYILRNNINEILGIFYFMFVVITCISTDIGGYVVGKIFKGPKLSKISPNKTYSGMIGSYIFSILIILILLNNSEKFLDKNIDYSIKYLIFTILISSVSQLGDITISYFKRLSDVIDTGKIIPGHGGILDRIDGMIFAFPFSLIIFNFYIFS